MALGLYLLFLHFCRRNQFTFSFSLLIQRYIFLSLPHTSSNVYLSIFLCFLLSLFLYLSLRLAYSHLFLFSQSAYTELVVNCKDPKAGQIIHKCTWYVHTLIQESTYFTSDYHIILFIHYSNTFRPSL